MCIKEEQVPLALILLYSLPDFQLMKASSNTVLSCIHQEDQGLIVINVKSILAGVAMVPHSNGDSKLAMNRLLYTCLPLF